MNTYFNKLDVVFRNIKKLNELNNYDLNIRDMNLLFNTNEDFEKVSFVYIQKSLSKLKEIGCINELNRIQVNADEILRKYLIEEYKTKIENIL
jgi:hypothetical protein